MHGNLPVAEPVSTTVTVGDPTTTTTSTAPKHGKLDLKDLRRKTKQTTANLNVQVSQHDKQDMSSIKKHLDKKKEIRAQVEDMNAKPKSSSYQNMDDFSPPARALAKIDNPPNKPPVAAPRVNIKSHPTPSGLKYEHWVCACCDMVNSAKLTVCRKCEMAQGALSISSAICGFCNLLAYISEERMSLTNVCPFCKDILHTVI